jgi:hypothetical protein
LLRIICEVEWREIWNSHCVNIYIEFVIVMRIIV